MSIFGASLITFLKYLFNPQGFMSWKENSGQSSRYET